MKASCPIQSFSKRCIEWLQLYRVYLLIKRHRYISWTSDGGKVSVDVPPTDILPPTFSRGFTVDIGTDSSFLRNLFQLFCCPLYYLIVGARWVVYKSFPLVVGTINFKSQRMSITVMSLPNETLSAIFDELPPSSLATAARVSTRFNAVAERILYSSIYITDQLSEDSPLPYKTLWWCNAIRRRAQFFESVRKVHIRWQADPSAPPPHYLFDPCEQLADVLRLLTPLESVDLFLGHANLVVPGPHPHLNLPPMHAVERVIRGCRFSQLRSCTLGAEWAKGVQPYTGVLIAFLASLTTLRHLRLSDLHSALDNLPSEALPLLSSFRGSADAAASLLPGRPVQYLSLIGQDSDVNHDNLPRMTCTTVPIRYLDLSAMSARPVLLRNVSTYLPTVESLRVKLALRHTLHYSFSGIRILAGLSSVLNAFHQLTYLDLSPTGIDGVGRADSLEELSLCTEWHRACPTLRRIIFPSQTEWILNPGNAWTLIHD